jgi:hypothetical protein
VNAINLTAAEPSGNEPFESGISDAPKRSERGNAVLDDARVLARYGGRDEELTKPSVMLLDWKDDEVTVRWDAVRHAAASEASGGASEDEAEEFYALKRFRGIGARSGSILLGLVLGVAVTIGVLAIFAPRAPAESNPAVGVALQASVDTLHSAFTP